MTVRGIVGKIPSEGDFVRRGLIEPPMRAFEQWLAASAEVELSRGPSNDAEPLRFVFGDRRHAGALVGVIAPSRDAVGRNYPLALFEWVPGVKGPSLSALPVAYQTFLEGAYALATEPGDRTPADLQRDLDALAPVGPEEHAKAAGVCARALDSTTVASFESRVFADPASERYYAYHSLLTAVSILTRGASFAPPTLDCPIATDVDLFVWLELVRRSLPPDHLVPTVLWTEDESPRLAVVLGEPAPADYLFREHDGGSDRIWPLTTSSVRAREEARARLLSIEPTAHGSLRALVEGVAGAMFLYAHGERR